MKWVITFFVCIKLIRFPLPPLLKEGLYCAFHLLVNLFIGRIYDGALGVEFNMREGFTKEAKNATELQNRGQLFPKLKKWSLDVFLEHERNT